jgi:hypothetical protein
LYVSAPDTINKKKRVWMVEPKVGEPLFAAYVLVQDEENMGKIPVQVLNLSDNPVIISSRQNLVSFAHLTAVKTEKGSTSKNDIAMETQIKEVIERTTLDAAKKEKLKEFLLARQDVFMEPTTLGNTKAVQHEIKTIGDSVTSNAYHYGHHENQEIKAQVQEKNVIRLLPSPWAALVVLVRKKDGSWRFCVDYRKLNAITVQNAFSLPRIDDVLNALSGAKYFTTLDAWTDYW